MECWNHGIMVKNAYLQCLDQGFWDQFSLFLHECSYKYPGRPPLRGNHGIPRSAWGGSLFDVEKLFKAQDTMSWPPARRAYASERIRRAYGSERIRHVWLQKVHWHPARGGIKRVQHDAYPGRNKAAAIVASLPAFTNRRWSWFQLPKKQPTNVSGLLQFGHCNGLMPV